MRGKGSKSLGPLAIASFFAPAVRMGKTCLWVVCVCDPGGVACVHAQWLCRVCESLLAIRSLSHRPPHPCPSFFTTPIVSCPPYPRANNKHLHSPLSKPFPHHNSTSSHADCQVLLLLGSHVPGPRHHLCPQRRQGMYVCVCICVPSLRSLRLFSCRALFMAPAYFVPSA